MNEMVERVAKAMKEQNDKSGAEDEAIFEASWETLASAAIASMREPTLEMIEDAMDIDDCSLLAEWRAMIDSALAQPETEATTK